MEKLLRPSEAARELGMKRQSICRAMDRGRLKFVVVAGYRLIRPRDLQAYAAGKTTGRPRKGVKREA